ncbi:hypothetical protein MLAC_45630 [Mycobacterium lacus]|uniref:Uncharacterized protein n=1 Tax=Mycobacterium lacus TaxID=169765 RepID=A0A7I7NSL2_9MYCO|nr:hypothetical protein MLAC_45630 [Mycobacterium lacus]
MARPTDITGSAAGRVVLAIALRPDEGDPARPAKSAELAIALRPDEGGPPRPAKSAVLAIALRPDEGDPPRPAKSAELAIALRLRGWSPPVHVWPLPPGRARDGRRASPDAGPGR